MTVNEFIKSMAAAGFDGSFRATNGEHTFRGTINTDGTISKLKVQSVNESRAKIKEMMDANKTNKTRAESS